jgi:hypothetical protein
MMFQSVLGLDVELARDLVTDLVQAGNINRLKNALTATYTSIIRSRACQRARLAA